MEFIENVDLVEYEEFVENNKYKSHFLQSSLWGEFCKIEKNLIPHYVGIKENGKLKCAALLLEKKLYFGYSYFYSPRGFVIDFKDVELVKLFTNKLKKYIKKNKGIFLKVDPDEIINKYNYLDELIEINNNTYKTLTKLGYKHLGFTKRFETSEPRYSFRIDFNQNFDEIENHFSKTTKQRIKKANDLKVKVKLDDNVNNFFELTSITEKRKGFITHNIDYYKNLYKIFKEKDKCNIFLGIVNIDEIVEINGNKINELLSEVNRIPDEMSRSTKNKLNELNKQIDKLKIDNINYLEIKEKYGNEIVLSAHFIVEYGNKAWVLYAGNHDILSYTYANYKTYFSHIKYYYDKGLKIYDQFGTVGHLEENDPLIGLHEFKKKFGGDYVEFVGEFDLITNKLMYFLFKKLIPFYRNRKFKENEKKNA